MLLDYYYLLKNYNASFLCADTKISCRFIIPLEEISAEEKNLLFRTLHASGHQFCFAFTGKRFKPDSGGTQEEIIRQLLILFFLPNYIKTGAKYVIFLDIQEAHVIDAIKEQVAGELARQGIREIMFEVITRLNGHDLILPVQSIAAVNTHLNDYLRNGTIAINFDALIKNFDLSRHFNKKILVPLQEGDNLNHKIKLIECFESWLALADPFKINLIKAAAAAERENEILKVQNQLLKVKVENNISYLEDLRKQTEWHVNNQASNSIMPSADLFPGDSNAYIRQLQNRVETEKEHANTILQWYIKEYEALPMWYKRFGQIIKVLTGKRTFTSLFK